MAVLLLGVVNIYFFRFETICNITQEPQELQRYRDSTCGFIDKSAV